jgi:hypothetical protein
MSLPEIKNSAKSKKSTLLVEGVRKKSTAKDLKNVSGTSCGIHEMLR